MRNRTIPILIALLVILFVSVSGVFANQVAVGQVGGDSVAATPKTQQVLDLYDPDPAQASFFNDHKIIAYSRTSRNGEQTDVIRAGNFDKELFIGSDKKIHVRRCGNVVYQIAVEKTIPVSRIEVTHEVTHEVVVKEITHEVTNEVTHEVVREVQPVVTNNYFTSAPVMCGQIGGQSPYMSNSMQLMSVNLVPLSDTNISVSASATGGAGGSSNVVNNNANSNTNVNANNNVINVGDGSASGTATGTGSSTANAGN